MVTTTQKTLQYVMADSAAQVPELGTEYPIQVSPQEQELFTAMVERMQQLRRHAGIPDGMTVQQAIGWHIISGEELENARWGTGGDTPDLTR